MSDKVSIIIPIYIVDYALFKMTKECFDDILFKTAKIETEVIVVNDCSPHSSFKEILKSKFSPGFKWVENTKNLGFAHSVNRGISKAVGDWVLLLNNDIKVLDKMWLYNMVYAAKEYKFDASAAEMGQLDHNCQYISISERGKTPSKFKYLCGWCMLLNRKIINEVGLIPTSFGKGFWEDTLYSQIIQTKENGKYKMGRIETDIEHYCHKTFVAAGYNINEQYMKNRAIFKKCMSKIRDISLEKISDYLDDSKF